MVTSANNSLRDSKAVASHGVWHRFCWHVYAYCTGLGQASRTQLTVAGTLLLLFTVGVAVAAYNSANNIIFLAFSVLVAAVLVSVWVAIVNVYGLSWRVEMPQHIRAGESFFFSTHISNQKRWFPAVGLCFVWQRMGKIEQVPFVCEPVVMPRATVSLRKEWSLPQRGVQTVKLSFVESCFPFGLLSRRVPGRWQRAITVWPERVEYPSLLLHGQQALGWQDQSVRRGQGEDFFQLRSYVAGDPVKHIHWKASARNRRFCIKEFAETPEGKWVLSVRSNWTKGQAGVIFEKVCGLASTLAEYLFKQGLLMAYQQDGQGLRPVARRQDYLALQECIAQLKPSPLSMEERLHPGSSVLSFSVVEDMVSIEINGKSCSQIKLS